MMDFFKIDSYKENNCLEVKSAAEGLPKSLWETYSAFANTLGGYILLGVEESPSGLVPINLKNSEKLIQQFWDIVNNRNKVSVNILSAKNVYIQDVDGKSIIVIYVPKAQRQDRPIYLNGNYAESYRRNGTGDYKCSKDEINAMIRDASSKSQDMIVLDETGFEVLDEDSIHSYRNRLSSARPGHIWLGLDDDEFLFRLGAAGRVNGALHPTTAGLLMFGKEYEITRVYPQYFLDYREKFDSSSRWTDRILSSSGDWSGNVYEFYFRAYEKIIRRIHTPFKIKNGIRTEDTKVHIAIREALANCLVNSDYNGAKGVVVLNEPNKLTISNPGNFRIDIETAKVGGVSDPRSPVLMKMFNLIGVGERAGEWNTGYLFGLEIKRMDRPTN